MSDNDTITDDQASAMREQLARYERQKAYEAALTRDALYQVLKPIVLSDEFVALYEKIKSVRNDGPKDDMYFGIPLDAVYNGMIGLGNQCSSWTTPVDPNATTTPPASEGSTNG